MSNLETLTRDTYSLDPMDKILACWDKMKKDDYGKHYQNQRKHCSPFFLSVDGMTGKKALVVLSILSRLVAEKMDEPILYVCVCINRRIAIAVARLY